MSFVYPSFLIALIALLIPILIHLFNFRRYKTVYFTNVKFLKEVKEERANRSRLKHLLVLLSRLLALSFLIFAFAQPFIPRDETEIVKGDKAVSVYIDNSQSMTATNKDISLMDKAKFKAREIVDAYGPSDRFQLLTNDLEGKHQRLVSKEEFISYLDEVKITPNVQKLSSILDRQKQVLEDSDLEQKNIFLISDFQKNIVDMETDTSYKYYFIPLQSANQQNVFIDTAYFESPIQMINTTNQLVYRLNNTGSADVSNSRLTLNINGQIKAINDFDLKAGASKIDTIKFSVNEGGWHRAELTLTDYPVVHDDSYYLTFYIDKKVNVLSINEGKNNRFLNALFEGDDYFELTNQSVNQLDYSNIKDYRLIVLNNINDISSGLAFELKQFLEQGGSVVVFPSLKMNTAKYNDFLKSIRVNTYTGINENEKQIGTINVQQEIFSNVFERIPRNIDLPKASKSFDMTRFAGSGEEILLKFQDGSSFLSKYNVQQGKIYLLSVPLDDAISNLPSHAIFVPMLYKIALVGGDLVPMAYEIGKDNVVEVKNLLQEETVSSESVMKMKSDGGEFIPGQKVIGNKAILSINNQLKTPGFYELFKNPTLPLAYFGFNFDRKESILDYLSPAELKERFSSDNINFLDNENADLKVEVGEINKGFTLWKWCLILALVFLFIEMILLRFWRD